MKDKLKKFMRDHEDHIVQGTIYACGIVLGGLVGYLVGVVKDSAEADALYEGLLIDHHEEIMTAIHKVLDSGEVLDNLKIREILIPFVITDTFKEN